MKSNLFLKSKKSGGGFTLIELLVVIGIIGVLAAVTMASLSASREKADDSKRNQDMSQVKTALELYAEKSHYEYPSLAKGGTFRAVSQFASRPTVIIQQTSSLFSYITEPVFADAVTHAEQACIQFDTLAQLLVNQGYLPSIPRDPRDAPSGTCYKAYSIDTDNNPQTIEAVAVYTILWEKYPIETDNEYGNKKTGFIVTKSAEVTPELAATVCTVTGEYPALDLANSSSLCTRGPDGKIADRVLGITDGDAFSSGDVVSDISSDQGSASDQQSDESSASDQGSDTGSSGGYCSDSQYTNQSDCTLDRSSCSNPAYGDSSSCTNNGEYVGASCSNSSYTDQSSCTSNGEYTGGYCSGGGYTDSGSCTSNGEYSGGYCSNGGYTNQYDCESAEYYWYYGSWNQYYWYSGSWVNYIWNSGSWQAYVWNSVPPATWYP